MFLLPWAGSILTPQLPGILEPGAWLDTQQPQGRPDIGIQSAREIWMCKLHLVESQAGADSMKSISSLYLIPSSKKDPQSATTQ